MERHGGPMTTDGDGEVERSPASTETLSPEDLRERFRGGWTFPEYPEEVEKNRDLWRDLHERVRIPEEVEGQLRAISAHRNLLALSEDWCGDAVNILPWVAHLSDASPKLELRVVSRDENPNLMDAHLWQGRSRSIPVVILLDEEFRELDWWGPRPRELQEWVMGEGLELPVKDRYREVRKWYARDRGDSIVAEILGMLQAHDR